MCKESSFAKAPGYLLRPNKEQLDVQEFERLHVAGTRLLTDGHPELASNWLRQALELWRGAPLADIPAGSTLAPIPAAWTRVATGQSALRPSRRSPPEALPP